MSSEEVREYANVAGRRVLERPISLQEMEDGIVSEKAFSSYCNDIIHFINWCSEQEEDRSLLLLTDLAKATVADLKTPRQGEGIKEHRARVKKTYMELIRQAKTAPLVNEENVTSNVVMLYIASGANQQTGKPLSESSYKGKRSAIFHLFCCQNGRSPSEEYMQKIANYWKGFGRMQSRKSQNPPQVDGNQDNDHDSNSASDDNEDDRDEFKEGKEPMSIELYRAVLKWMIEYGSSDSLLAACFLCLTWNLACRSNNTAKLKLSHLSTMTLLKIAHYFL